MPDLNFLLGRPPITIPNGILPDDFIPMSGSVYDSFAAGLPAVIFLNGEYYPLSQAELEFLKQSFIQDSASQTTSTSGPESIPNMPSFPASPEEIDDLRKFEQKAEQLFEKKDPAVEQVKSPEVTATNSTSQAAASDDTGAPKPLVSLEELVNAGKQMVDKTSAESIVTEFSQGKRNVSKKNSSDSLDWLKLLLLKLYRQRFPN